MLRILLIGLGSIGRKHISCIKELGNIEIAALRTSKGTLKDAIDIKEVFSIEDALNYKPNGVIISNPTSLHVKTALPFLELGIPVLIEKPIGYSAKESYVLDKYSSLVRVAYCMRFHPLNEIIKNIIETENIFKLGFKRSFYLPNWHPYADYRSEYTARKELGGGVIRTLSHEIDLMIHWFGLPESSVGVVDKISNLEIDTDDYAFFTCKFKQGFRVNFELDFLSPVNINKSELYTNMGKYHWDLKQFWLTNYKDEQPKLMYSFSEDSIDNMYLEQIKDFVAFIKSKKSSNTTLVEAQEILKLIENIDD